jgi:hypothetical protein
VLNLGQGTVGGALVATSNGGAINQSGPLTVTGTANVTAGAAPINLTSANDFQGTVTLSNSGPNDVQITDTNTIAFTNLVLGRNLTVNGVTIDAHDTTTFGSQLWNGNVTFHSTETTNGGSFQVTGTTTLGSNTVIATGTGPANVTLSGAVIGTTPGGQSLTVNSGGTTSFGSTVGSSSTPISNLTTDAGGSTVFNGNVFTGTAPGATGSAATTPTITLGDPASGTGTLNSTTGGLISVNNVSGVSIGTTGSVVFTGTGTVGTAGSPLVFAQTPLNVQTTNAITLTFSSPASPTNLIFASGSSVSAFLGGSSSSVSLAANASQLQANATVSSVQGTAAAAVSEAAKAGFDTDSVAQQINYGFAGDVGVSPPMEHRLDETGIAVPEGFGEEEEAPAAK